MNESPLDKAILAYRENPTEQNKQMLLAAQAQQGLSFQTSQATEFIRRTK